MTRRKKRKRVPVALTISILVHGMIILALILFARSRVPSKHGVITVDFIESVHHSPAAPNFRPKAAPTPNTGKAAMPTPESDAAAAFADDSAERAQETETYIHSVFQIVSRSKVYPRESLSREEEGRVVIGVSVLASGAIDEVRIEEACSFQRLNEAALKTIREIKSFPPLPTTIEAPLHLHIPISYQMESQ